MEVGAQFMLSPLEKIEAIYVAVYPIVPPIGEYWPKKAERVLNNEKPYGVVEAKYFPEKKKHLGLVKVKAKDVVWQGLWWAPENADTAHFVVSVLVVGKDKVITRNVFGGTALRPKKKK